MRITITARHCDIPNDLRERARTLVERLARMAGRALDARVTFGTDHGAAAVELRLHRARRHVHVAAATGADYRSALDRAAAKVRRQLDKPPARRVRAAVREPR